MQAIWSFSCSFGYNQIKSVRFTLKSRGFPKFLLHLRYTFQNIKLEYKIPWVTEKKMHKAKQNQDRKRLKFFNVLIAKETPCWEWQEFVVCPSFRKEHRKTCFLFLLFFDWESTTFPRSSILPIIKVSGSTFCWLVVYSMDLELT